MTSKQCTKCSTNKPISDFLFRKDEKRYIAQCKKCLQERINHYKRTNDEYKKRYNEYRKNKRINDPEYAIKERLRARIRKMLKSQDASKYIKTFVLLGCTLEEFKKHIISKFYGDMSWEKKNFELDHIIPCSWFNLQNPIHQKICFNYKNLQPLTHEDNAKKGDKVWIEYNLLKNPYI